MSRALSITELANMLSRGSDEEGPVSFDPARFEDAGFGSPSSPAGERAVVPVDPASPMPRHFAPDPQIAKALGVMPSFPEEDPIRQAWKSGFEDGVATEKRLAGEMRGEDMEAFNHLREQFRQINASGMQLLESRLREAVVTLCRQVIDDCPIAPERLAIRIQTAVRMLASSHNEKTIEVSPQDFKLLGGLLPPEWTLVANPDIARGAIRVLTVDGGIEDGPEQWKLALEEAIRTC